MSVETISPNNVAKDRVDEASAGEVVPIHVEFMYLALPNLILRKSH